MRYNDILREHNNNDILREHNNLATCFETLSHECSEILNVIKKCGPLYRGLQYFGNEDFMKCPIRKDRRPKDTPKEISDEIDCLLTMKGFSAVRTNSVFCTANVTTAAMYGNTYFIFPVNGFKYTWFLESKDLYHSVKDFIGLTQHFEDYDEEDYDRYVREFLENAKDFINLVKPQDTNIELAITKGYEIMITGSDYYALSTNHTQTLRKFLSGGIDAI